MLIKLKLFYLILVSIIINIQYVYGIFEFRKVRYDNNYGVTLTNDELLSAVEMGKSNFEMLKNLENTLINSNVKLSYGSSSYGQYLESWPNEKAKEIDKIAQTILKASIQLLNMNCLLNNPSKRENCAEIISSFHLPMNSGIKENCTAFKQESTNYLHTYRRLLPANYADGIYKMHTVNVQPKGISNRFYDSQVINEKNAPSSPEGILDAEKNIALVQWTQFIEHDLAKTIVQTMCNNEPIECCNDNLNHPRPRHLHPSCAALNIEGLNSIVRCLNYVRSALGIDYDCKFGPANQLNQATNQLDLSQLYGTTKEEKNNLRTFMNGELKSSDHPEYSYLPESNAADRLCMHDQNDENNICYKSGDTRVNANPYTITLYTIFLRSHNMLAKKIRQQIISTNNAQQINDNDIYERAKKLNKYIYQKIIYEEWAKIVLGDVVTEQLNNEPFRPPNNHPQVSDKSVSNEFATAGIRFYYSMIPGDLSVNDELSIAPSQFNVINSLRKTTLKLENEFYKPQDLSFEYRMENFLEAILNQRAMAMDSGYVDDVIKKLFCYPIASHQNQSVGTDVLALDIVRGRDHGLANYISYLTGCTKDVILNWDDLKKYINNRDILLLKEIYTTPDKIDLIVGAITEKPLHGGTVGPTLQCIIGEQLSNTRQTDEEFYKRPSERNFYNQISQYTGAKLLCETTKLTEVPRNIFKIPSASNPLVKCNTLT